MTIAGDGSALFVAARGDSRPDSGGLYRFVADGQGNWSGEQLGVADGLAALSSHPRLPVLYGVSGVEVGMLHVWTVSESGHIDTVTLPSAGREPCHIGVDPAGTVLVVSNYSSNSLAVFPLGARGEVVDKPTLYPLEGSGPERERQSQAHPHQALFDSDGSHLTVIDLGADVIRRFRHERGQLVARETRPTPAGSGPRHAVIDANNDVLCVSGELDSTMLVSDGAGAGAGVAAAAAAGAGSGPAGTGAGTGWQVVPSTRRSGPAKTRSERNYPGDIARHPVADVAYLANRGYDTIAVVTLAGERSSLIQEVDSGVCWPQHLRVTETELFVAGWDSSCVASLPLDARDGRIRGEAATLFECPGACWLLPVPPQFAGLWR